MSEAEEEREDLSSIQTLMLDGDNPEVVFAVFITVRWAFGVGQAIHEWAVWNLCRGQLDDGVGEIDSPRLLQRMHRSKRA